MPNKYVRKTDKGGKYTREQLQQAVAEVKSVVYTAYRASKNYNIPLTTIIDHIKGRRGKKSHSFGRSTALPLQDEKTLVAGLTYMEKYGYGLSRKEVLDIVGTYVKEKGLKTPFKDGVPSKDWFIAFKQRHNLSLKKPQSVEYAREKACDPFIIKHYFNNLKSTIDELNLSDKPHLIWNFDETSFCEDPSKTKVIGPKGSTATRTTSSPGKENISVLLGCSAAGAKAPPLIIFKGKNIWDQFMAPQNTGFPGTTYAATTNGWMETSVFENYFKNSFFNNLGSERPVLIIFFFLVAVGRIVHNSQQLNVSFSLNFSKARERVLGYYFSHPGVDQGDFAQKR
ncbi:uncharacterized protein [Leptinotarsa decemlineata]|uniref:uncharacterized protein n=1 Tax=Leptinotarsa decemlineata TaxID=7539 RepID=UPI003D30AF8E